MEREPFSTPCEPVATVRPSREPPAGRSRTGALLAAMACSAVTLALWDIGIPAIGSVDVDQDGFSGQADCRAFDPRAYPGALESQNGIDDDCDGSVDEMAFVVVIRSAPPSPCPFPDLCAEHERLRLDLDRLEERIDRQQAETDALLRSIDRHLTRLARLPEPTAYRAPAR